MKPLALLLACFICTWPMQPRMKFSKHTCYQLVPGRGAVVVRCNRI